MHVWLRVTCCNPSTTENNEIKERKNKKNKNKHDHVDYLLLVNYNEEAD